MKRFFVLLTLVTSFCQASGVFESRALTFEEIDQKIIFQKTEMAKISPTRSPKDFVLNPQSTIIFIDLDDTFLDHDGRADGTQTLTHPDNVRYLKKWKDAGFHVAFLTSRAESEREATKRNLKAVGVKEEWAIPLLIVGSGVKKGDWLFENRDYYLRVPHIKTIIHIDDKKHQLDSMRSSVCPGHACYLVHFDQQPDVTLSNASIPSDITRFTLEQTTTGGNQATFILKEGENPRYVLKKDLKGEGTKRTEQFKEEVLADALYEVIGNTEPFFGIHVPKFKVIVKDAVYQRISEYLEGKALGFNNQAEVAKGFVVDAFMANWDLVVNGKNLWLSNAGIVYRMDNGGSLRYRAIGELKSTTGYDFSSAKCDLYTLRGQPCPSNPSLEVSTNGQKFYGSLTEKEILTQIEKFIPLKDKVLQIADQYNDALLIQNYEQLRSNLVTRFNSLKEYYYDHPQVLTRYERAHPFRTVVPGQSSASVLIYAVQEGRPLILLGKRTRHNWWGNFGGEADNVDQTLLDTAVREVKEESMGEYVFLKEELLKAPSHDLIKGGDTSDALHRMYLMKGNYVDPREFKKKLEVEKKIHSKEYTDFAWVDVRALLTVVEENLKTSNDSGNERQYAVEVMDVIAESESVPVASSTASAASAAAAQQVEPRITQIYIHHPLMDMLRQEPVLNWLKAIVTKKEPRVANTAGSIGSLKLKRQIEDPILPGNVIEHDDLRYPTPTFFDPRSERIEKLHYTTTKHMDVLTELKKRKKTDDLIAKKQRNDAARYGYSIDPEHYRPILPQTAATDAYLQFALGADYMPFNPQENVYNFLNDYSELSKSYAAEFSETSPSCGVAASYKCAILQAMEKEREMKDWFVLYHTLPGKLGFLYDVFTEFRNVLRVRGSDSMHSLRAFDKFFKGLENVEQFVAEEMRAQEITDFASFDNYGDQGEKKGLGHYQERGLSTNITLFGSKDVNTSSTFHMFHENKTVSPPDYERLLSALFSEFGITDTKKYLDLFDRYFGKTVRTTAAGATTETGENHLLQIFINPTVIDDIIYLAGSMGKGLYNTFEMQKQELQPSVFLKELREDPTRAHEKLQVSELTDHKGGGLHRVQARLFMKPEMMTDPSKVQIVRYTKTQIQERYFQELKEMVRKDLSHWLKQHYELQGNTLENPSQEGVNQALPPLQKVDRHLDQAEGIAYQTKTPEELYGRFLMEDNVEGIKQILARIPDFDLFKKIPNPDYKKNANMTIDSIDLIIQKQKIREYLLSIGKIHIISNDEDMQKTLRNPVTIKNVVIVGNITTADLSRFTTLEEIFLDSNSKVDILTLPNSSSLKSVVLRGIITTVSDLNLSQATALEEIELGSDSQIRVLTLPNAPSLKRVYLEGDNKHVLDFSSRRQATIVHNLDLSQAKALEEIYLGSGSQIVALILPNALSLKKVELMGNVISADLSRATALEEFFLDSNSKVGTLTLPNSLSLKSVVLRGIIITASDLNLSRATALEEIFLGGYSKVGILTLPNVPSLKRVYLEGNITTASDLNLSLAKDLEAIELGRDSQIRTLTLPNSRSLKRVVLQGTTTTADLSAATTLEEIFLDFYSKVGILTLPNAPFLKRVYLEGYIKNEFDLNLSSATALEEINLDGKLIVGTLTLPKSKHELGKLLSKTKVAKIEYMPDEFAMGSNASGGGTAAASAAS